MHLYESNNDFQGLYIISVLCNCSNIVEKIDESSNICYIYEKHSILAPKSEKTLVLGGWTKLLTNLLKNTIQVPSASDSIVYFNSYFIFLKNGFQT